MILGWLTNLGPICRRCVNKAAWLGYAVKAPGKKCMACKEKLDGALH